MSINFEHIKAPAFVAVFAFTISSLSSGLLFIYIFTQHYFLSLDVIKLSLLSISISCPLIFMNSLFFASRVEFQTSNNESKLYQPSFLLLCGTTVSLPSIYLTLFTGYIFNLAPFYGVLILAGLELATIIILLASKKIIR